LELVGWATGRHQSVEKLNITKSLSSGCYLT